jgi:hypothetical protein
VAPAQLRLNAGLRAGTFEHLEGLLSLDRVVIGVRPAPDVGISGGNVRERELPTPREQHLRKRDRIATATVSIDSDEDVAEYFLFLPKPS